MLLLMPVLSFPLARRSSILRVYRCTIRILNLKPVKSVIDEERWFIKHVLERHLSPDPTHLHVRIPNAIK